MWIASIARHFGMIVVSNDKHFQNIDDLILESIN